MRRSYRHRPVPGHVCLAGARRRRPERAARLDGAAQGIRQRAGLPKWPLLRRTEAELVARVRQRLGADLFDQMFPALSALTRREAVAIIRDQHGTGTGTS